MIRMNGLVTVCALFVMTPLFVIAAEPETALSGYCPVCLVKGNKLVKGDPKISSVYDGKSYLFPSSEQKRMFDANPAAFVPTLGGNCTVCKVEMNKDVPGKADFHVTRNGRLYLFPSAKQRDMFLANPDKYADADVVLGGNCSVCKIELRKDVPGDPEISVDYNGRRYLFPAEKQRRMFLANLSKYTTEES